MQKQTLTAACAQLQAGKVIAYPTEAVWGLGCDPFNASAVRRILRLKQRPESKGLILVAASTDQLQVLLAPLKPAALALLTETWPGPVTWLIPDPKDMFPRWIKGQHKQVAIRVSAHPIVHALCQEFGRPIVSTSANRSGRPAIRSKAQLLAEFGVAGDAMPEGSASSAGRKGPSKPKSHGKMGGSGSSAGSPNARVSTSDAIDFIVPGRLGGQQQPSEIRDLVSGKVLRSG